MVHIDLLRGLDDAVSWMEPSDFDQEVAERRFHDFVHELSTMLGPIVKTETGELLQDAIYHSEAFLLVGDEPQPSIRFSRFDSLATLCFEEKVPKTWQTAIENLLSRHGYLYVPASVLAQPYTGNNKREDPFPDWFSRFFGA